MGNSELDQALHDSVLKRRAPFEAAQAEKDREAREKYEAESALLGAGELTKEKLQKILDQNRGMYYRTEELNDRLFLHFGGFRKLENLEKFTGLKTLYAESNALESMEGIETMSKLRSIFLQQNCIRRIENLECLPELWSLNLGENFIDKIEGLSHVPQLNTLNLAGNRIGFGGLSDVIDLVGSSVSCLDIQNNKIDDVDFLPEVLMRMPQLKVLYLKGNPICKKLPSYRKTLIAHLPRLSYLDDRPVFKDEARCSAAFFRGGIEEEREERKRIKQEERDAHLRNGIAFREMISRAQREKRERESLLKEDKYDEENLDPVETQDQKMAKSKDKWMKENAKDLKDDAKEHALKKLKAERMSEEAKTEREAKEAKETEKKEEADADAKHQPADTEKPQQVETEESKIKIGANDQDNRKLTYDDIWNDDGDVVFSTKKKEPARSAFNPPARGPISGAGAKNTSSSRARICEGEKNNEHTDIEAEREEAWACLDEQEMIDALRHKDSSSLEALVNKTVKTMCDDAQKSRQEQQQQQTQEQEYKEGEKGRSERKEDGGGGWSLPITEVTGEECVEKKTKSNEVIKSETEDIKGVPDTDSTITALINEINEMD